MALKKEDGSLKFPVIVVSSDPEAEVTAYGECKAVCFVLKGARTITELTKAIGAVFGDSGQMVSLEPGH